MTVSRAAPLLCLLFIGAPLWADLERAKAETNLEKRSKLALENADDALKAARDSYKSGDVRATADSLKQVQESVELANTSLSETGKNPRKSPKWFKRAEIATRDLLRKLDGLEQEMSYNDRGVIKEVKARIQKIHDDLLIGLMEGKK